MKRQLLKVYVLCTTCLVSLSGCTDRVPYPTPDLSVPTARLWFSLDSDRAGPKVIAFDHLPGAVRCKARADDTQALAVISLGKPDVQTTGEGGVRVLTGGTFRLMAYSGDAQSPCQGAAAFTPVAKQEYRVVYHRRGATCAVSVRILDDSSGRRIWREEPSFKQLKCDG
ncbi:MAG: hypothetical protein GKR94_20825 [Gammaproteobacteria bacterium]|nr:hypothetical protein [Gammaproteobacteria bacterium]